MPIIKPRTRGKQFVHYHARLDRENHETLCAYAAFIGEDPAYVVNAVIDTVLAKDKEFAAWRAEHPQSFAPAPSTTPKRNRRAARGVDAARTATAGVAVARPNLRDRLVSESPS
jgi:hypothetical protein